MDETETNKDHHNQSVISPFIISSGFTHPTRADGETSRRARSPWRERRRQNGFPGPSKSDAKYIPRVRRPLVAFLYISDLSALGVMGRACERRRDREWEGEGEGFVRNEVGVGE